MRGPGRKTYPPGRCSAAPRGGMLRAPPPGVLAMIGYVTLGTNDLARAARFYDALLAEIGGKRTM